MLELNREKVGMGFSVAASNISTNILSCRGKIRLEGVQFCRTDFLHLRSNMCSKFTFALLCQVERDFAWKNGETSFSMRGSGKQCSNSLRIFVIVNFIVKNENFRPIRCVLTISWHVIYFNHLWLGKPFGQCIQLRLKDPIAPNNMIYLTLNLSIAMFQILNHKWSFRTLT